MPEMLQYASPRERLGRELHLRKVMIACWLLPLAVGVSILFAWIVTRAQMLPVLGLLWIFVGTILALVGGILLLVWLVSELRDGKPAGPTSARFILLAAMIVSNFGAAWLCMLAATTVHPL